MLPAELFDSFEVTAYPFATPPYEYKAEPRDLAQPLDVRMRSYRRDTRSASAFAAGATTQRFPRSATITLKPVSESPLPIAAVSYVQLL